MTPRPQPGAPLGEALGASALFRDWLAGRLPATLSAGGGAAAELSRALSEPATGPGPWFADRGAEAPAVVVTGQQPGFLGGPLYTLLKAATTVALAELRREAGLPTLPLLWSGDDDEDLLEACEPVGWDPESARPVGVAGREQRAVLRRRRQAVGSLESRHWDGPARELLGRLADRPGAPALANDLAALWERADRETWRWARLQRELLQRLLGARGLQVVSGDDPALHAAGAPLYERILPQLTELGELARRRGQALAAGGWHAQIGAAGLARPLFRVAAGRRQALDPAAGVAPAASLRPGVLLRSPLQDWLLQPVAVVAGPGELAYLRQLDPVYERLQVPRCPLVPRLFAWLVPPGFEAARLERFRRASLLSERRSADLAAEAAAAAAARLGSVLRKELGLAVERADALAAGRARRWERGVGAMLRAESRRLARERMPRDPGWVFVEGVRQERRLALAAACALWGDPLVDAVVAAAREHLAAGARGDWHEFTIEVPDPARA